MRLARGTGKRYLRLGYALLHGRLTMPHLLGASGQALHAIMQHHSGRITHIIRYQGCLFSLIAASTVCMTQIEDVH